MTQHIAEGPATALRRILIVDDHPLYNDALASALSHMLPGCTFEKTGTLSGALSVVDSGQEFDLVIFDLKLPDVIGISGFLNLRDRLPMTPILVVSSLASPEVVHRLIEQGAFGFMPKDSSAQEITEAVLGIASGHKYVHQDFQSALSNVTETTVEAEDPHSKLAALTPQQKRVMKLICAGKPNKVIAYELDLAEATVKAHITALLRRLGVQNRTQAAVLAEAAQMDLADRADDPDDRFFLTR